MADRIADPWGARTPYRRGGDWPIRVDEHMDGPVDRWVQSACVLCSHGCALDIGVREGKIVGVRGRAAKAACDQELLTLATECHSETDV